MTPGGYGSSSCGYPLFAVAPKEFPTGRVSGERAPALVWVGGRWNGRCDGGRHTARGGCGTRWRSPPDCVGVSQAGSSVSSVRSAPPLPAVFLRAMLGAGAPALLLRPAGGSAVAPAH